MTDALSRIVTATVFCLGLGIALFAIYVAGYGSFSPAFFRGGVVCISILVAGLSLIAVALTDRKWFDVLVIAIVTAVGVAASLVFINVQRRMETEFYFPSDLEVWIGAAGVLAIVELTRRHWGNALAIVASFFVAFVFVGPFMPGFLRHSGFALGATVDSLWFNYSGAFGTPVAIIAGLVWIFIVFGVMLNATGAADSLLKLANVLTARTRGGPAHGAIVASSMFGSMSGAAIANVVGTGTFTIPMMKRRGFPPAFAGGVEATASCGGQIVPPIMGAAAFLMAELTGTPYAQIALAALMPALFYYLSLFISVSIEARRLEIPRQDPSDIPRLTRKDALASVTFIGPIIGIVVALVLGYSAAFAGFSGLLLALALSFLNAKVRGDPLRLVRALSKGGVTAAKLMVAVTLIGVIIGVVNMTGVGLRFATLIEALGGGSLYLSLVLTMFGAILLGMGMPTLPAYLIVIVIMGPAFTRMGLDLIAIHMFVLYYAVASSITPPVALAAYAASSIAEAKPLSTSIMAVRLGAAKYIMPFIFVTYPSFLLVTSFDWAEFVWLIPRVVLMIWLVSTALSRYEFGRLGPVQVALRLLSAFLTLHLDPAFQAAGIALAAGLIGLSWSRARAGTAG